MALQDFGPVRFPDPTFRVIGNTSLTLDADGERVGNIVRIPVAGQIEGFGFYIPLTTTGDTLLGSAENVSSGSPDGTPDQSGTVVVANGDDDTFKSVTFGANRTVSVDDVVAFVLGFNSFVAGNLTIGVCNDLATASEYVSHRTGGSYTKQLRGANVAVRYSGGVYHPIPGCLPGARVTSTDFASNTTPDEVALYITTAEEMSVVGMGFVGRLNANTDLVLDNSGGSALETCSMAGTDTVVATNSEPRECRFAARTLAAGTYRVTLKPTTTTANRLYYFDVASAAMLDQCSGGQEAHWSQRTDAGAWTETTTRRPMIYLIVNQVHDGTGGAGGGMIYPRPMSGGLT